MNEEESLNPQPIEKSALKDGESDSGASQGSTQIDTFDDLKSTGEPQPETFDDLKNTGEPQPETFDDLKSTGEPQPETFDDLKDMERAQNDIDQKQIKKIMEKLRGSESERYVEKNLEDFENVEIKKTSELPYWNKINKFLDSKEIADDDVIVIGGKERWQSIYGSNDSKSSHKPSAILLKKEIFDREDISGEDISWLIHEIGHIEFYRGLGEGVDEYMEEYCAKGEYTSSEMEKSAFKLQFEYLESIGKTKTECDEFVINYLDKSFKGSENNEKAWEELKQIREYLNEVYEDSKVVNESNSKNKEIGSQESFSDNYKERELKWDEKCEEIRRRVDEIGGEMEEGIIETVAAFNVFNIPTSQSCEGHTDWGIPAPWVMMQAEDESAEDFKEKNENYRKAVESLVKNYYEEIRGSIPVALQIKLVDIGDESILRLYIGSEEDYNLETETLSDQQRSELAERLSEYREEMKKFTNFIKSKYLKEGDEYLESL